MGGGEVEKEYKGGGERSEVWVARGVAGGEVRGAERWREAGGGGGEICTQRHESLIPLHLQSQAKRQTKKRVIIQYSFRLPHFSLSGSLLLCPAREGRGGVIFIVLLIVFQVTGILHLFFVNTLGGKVQQRMEVK